MCGHHSKKQLLKLVAAALNPHRLSIDTGGAQNPGQAATLVVEPRLSEHMNAQPQRKIQPTSFNCFK